MSDLSPDVEKALKAAKEATLRFAMEFLMENPQVISKLKEPFIRADVPSESPGPARSSVKSPGQALCEASGERWDDLGSEGRGRYENHAQAVVAHVVGPNRVVAERSLLTEVYDNLRSPGPNTRDVAERVYDVLL